MIVYAPVRFRDSIIEHETATDWTAIVRQICREHPLGQALQTKDVPTAGYYYRRVMCAEGLGAD